MNTPAKNIKPGHLIRLKTNNPHQTDGWVLVYMNEDWRSPNGDDYKKITFGGVGALQALMLLPEQAVETREDYHKPTIIK